MQKSLGTWLALSRTANMSLSAQIVEQIRREIVRGRLAAGDQLPATRPLAQELGVSRTTVVKAYDQLAAEGYLRGVRGAGHVVQNLGSVEALEEAPVLAKAVSTGQRGVRAELLPEQRGQGHPGIPDPALFPLRQWLRCQSRVSREESGELFASAEPFGYRRLREAVTDYLASWRGLQVHPDQVLMTAGSIDALETCLRALLASGEGVGLECPGYRNLVHIVKNQGLRVQWLRVDEQGAVVPSADNVKPRLLVLTPSHQFPLGPVMPIDRRRAFQRWAAENNAWIIEDDYDSEYRYAGQPIPALASVDPHGRSVYVGTFSKVLSPHLRIGYVVMPEALIGRFETIQRQYGSKVALPLQPVLAAFVQSGEYYRHIRRTRRIYAERRQNLLAGMTRHLSEFLQWQDHQCGMQITTTFRPDCVIDDVALAMDAQAEGIGVEALSLYYSDQPPQRGLLVGFTQCDTVTTDDHLQWLRTRIVAKMQGLKV